MASYRLVMDEIHVLLVDHELQDANNTIRLLEMYRYRVTLVELASAAIKMLLRDETKFDVIMANINSPDLYGPSLLQHAVYVDIPIILMSTDDNATMAKRVIEDGAYLCIKKPATMETLRFLWQHVMREKMRMIKERERLTRSYNVQGIKFEDHAMINNRNKRKVCMEWTEELHEKFVNAIKELGEGRCFPKDILDLMNVSNLTRTQVASHLQKCRKNSWQLPKERKSNSTIRHVSSDTNGSQQNPRGFGSMPRLGRVPSSHVKTSKPNDVEIENMKTQAIMINTSHELNLDNIKQGTNSSYIEPPPGFEKKFEVPNMDAEGKGSLETSKFSIHESKNKQGL